MAGVMAERRREDREMYGQRMAPGMHRLVFIEGYRTFFRSKYLEDWRCKGCGLRIWIKSADPEVLDDLIHTFRDEHSGIMSAYAVLNRVKSMRGRCRDAGVKVRFEFTEWQIIKLNKGKRTVQ